MHTVEYDDDGLGVTIRMQNDAPVTLVVCNICGCDTPKHESGTVTTQNHGEPARELRVCPKCLPTVAHWRDNGEAYLP